MSTGRGSASSALRSVLSRIGGPNAITWPAFWVSLVYNEFVHFAGNPTNTSDIPQRFVLIIVSQLAMFVPLVLARFTYLKHTGERPRPTLTLLTFAGAGAVRGLVTAYGMVFLGAASTLQLGYRVMAGVISVTVILSLTAIVVDGIREHQRRLQALLMTRQALDEARAQTLLGIEDRQEEVVRRIQDGLLAELASLDPGRPEASVALLQHTATEVVRPLSHDLAASVPSWQPRDLTKRELRIDWGQVLQDATYQRPFRPWGTGICLMAFAFVFLLTFFGPLSTLMTVLATVLISAGWFGLMNRWTAGFLPRLGLGSRVLLISAANLIGGFLIGAAQYVTSGRTIDAAVSWGSTVLFTFLFAWLLTITGAVERQRERLQVSLEEDEAELRWQLARIHQVQWFQQKALSRALHGPVQSAVTAAAIRLDSAVREGASTPELVHQLQEQITGSIALLDKTHHSVASLTDSIDLLTQSWAGVCEVSGEVQNDAEEALEADDVARACVADLMTEAVSNAVRHGRARHVDLTIGGQTRAVELLVLDDGTAAVPTTGARTGLGSSILEDCALTWSRTPRATGYELRAVLPVEV